MNVTTMLVSVIVAGSVVAALLAVCWPSAERSRMLELRRTLYTYARPVRAAEKSGDPARRTRARPLRRRPELLADRFLQLVGKEDEARAAFSAAAVDLRPGQGVVRWVAIILATTVVSGLLSGWTWVGIAIGAVIGGGLPRLFLSIATSRRRNAFATALPDMLTTLAGGLQAGHSVEQSLEATVDTVGTVMADELRRAVTDTQLGSTTDEALSAVATRMANQNLEWVALALRLNRGVGGRLAEVLTKVAATIRERESMRRHVKALAAEGRLSMWVLGGLPVVMFGYLALSRPEYILPFIATPVGAAAMIVAALMVVGGMLVMSKIAKVEI